MTDTANEVLNNLNIRLSKYAEVLKAAEDENNASKVRRYKRIVSQYEKTIKDVKLGRPCQLGELPSPPGFPSLVSPQIPEDVAPPSHPDHSTPDRDDISENPEAPVITIDSEDAEMDEMPMLQKLKMRLEKYQSVLKAAEAEESAAKIRRYKRIIAQYNDAIKMVSNGKCFDLSELPNPPGFPSIVPPKSPLPSPQPSPKPVRSRPPSPSPNNSAVSSTSPSPPKRALTRADKQTLMLRERQKEYKDAAIAAKKADQIEEAKEFLKIYKGFDRLILASESGLPVDLTSIPVSLQATAQIDEEFHLVSEKDFSGEADVDVYTMLKNELQDQIKSCMKRRNEFKNTGDVANANRFEQWALTFKKDLNKIMMYHSSSQPVPKFHYEQKIFPSVLCFSEIPAGELELSIVQGVNLAKVCDTYVGYEFPFPSESMPSGYTSVVKNSMCPEYNFDITFSIDRDSKPCQRIFKRHGVKLEVWSKGGFLRKDVSLGTVTIKLLPLTTDIIVHDAFDIMNGRRPSGAKLEVKLRMREPLLTKKITNISEKWLLLD